MTPTMTPSDDNDYKRQMNDFYSVLEEKLQHYRDAKRHLDRFLSTDFNVFEVIRPDEDRLSEIIADLLDPSGSHGQQRKFLDAFLQVIKRCDLKNKRLSKIDREIPIPGGRLDILIKFENFMLAIENKPWASEGKDQLQRYHNYLQKNCGEDMFCLVFLTPEGDEPTSIEKNLKKELLDNKKLICVSYSTDILKWVEECCRLCESDKFLWFLRDFTNYIPTMEEEMPNAEETNIIVRHAIKEEKNLKMALDVHSAYDDLLEKILDDFYKGFEECLKRHLSNKWEFIPDKEGKSFGFAKKQWNKRYQIGMQYENKGNISLGVYRERKNAGPINDLVAAIEGTMQAKGKEKTDWWEYQFNFGSKTLVEMQFDRDAIVDGVCQKLVRISRITEAMQLIDNACLRQNPKQSSRTGTNPRRKKAKTLDPQSSRG